MVRRKARPRKGASKITDSHVFDLVVGRSFFPGGFDNDLDEMRTAWGDPQVQDRVRAR